MPKVEKAKNEVGRKREKISVYENKVNELNKLKNDLNICDVDLDNSLNEHNRNNRQILMLNEQIMELEKDLVKEIKDGELKGEISKTEIRVKDMQNEMDSIRQKLNEFNIKKSNAEEIINKISEIEKCPLCLQNVEHDHKSAITEREDKNIKDYEQNMRLISVKETETKDLMDSLQNELEILRKKENSMELMKLKLKNAKEKREEKQNLEKLQVDKKKKIGEINAEKIELNKKIGEIKNVEEDYKIVKIQLDMALEEEKKLDIEKAGMEKENESLNRVVKNLGEEVDKKSKAKEKLNYFVDVQNWLENYFVNLMSTMEKHIMLQVYREFNELFKTWFNILIEDETISVRLDDEFTPIIEQNGYDTNVGSLSGGEKTSVALSYRLALNKVINDIVSDIKTKDILMLDEPTDGFSSEQLDKVRDVLEQLNIKQIIIVSHESKIESFVDSVIRIGKEEHVSLIY